MTTAEANNERATVEEFRANLYALIRDAQKAGMPEYLIHKVHLETNVAEVLNLDSVWPEETL